MLNALDSLQVTERQQSHEAAIVEAYPNAVQLQVEERGRRLAYRANARLLELVLLAERT